MNDKQNRGYEVMRAATECLRQAGDEEVEIAGGENGEVVVTRPGSQSSSVYTEDEFIAKYTPVNALKVYSEALTSLTPSQDEEIETLRRRVQQLEAERDGIVMGASIKLATARMVLGRLIPQLDGPDRAALEAVLDVLPAPAQKRIQ